jgi:hypothetical protein
MWSSDLNLQETYKIYNIILKVLTTSGGAWCSGLDMISN